MNMELNDAPGAEPVKTVELIETKPILNYFQGKWGITPSEYELKAVKQGDLALQVDFQDLMVNVTERQALAIEQEVKPTATRIKARTKRLKQCGDGMAELSEFSFKTESDKPNPQPEKAGKISVATADLVNALAGRTILTASDNAMPYKKDVDSANQYLKTESDRLNNEQQLAMSRMETLVQGRDQNFSTAATLMNHVSESRGSTIRSMG